MFIDFCWISIYFSEIPMDVNWFQIFVDILQLFMDFCGISWNSNECFSSIFLEFPCFSQIFFEFLRTFVDVPRMFDFPRICIDFKRFPMNFKHFRWFSLIFRESLRIFYRFPLICVDAQQLFFDFLRICISFRRFSYKLHDLLCIFSLRFYKFWWFRRVFSMDFS